MKVRYIFLLLTVIIFTTAASAMGQSPRVSNAAAGAGDVTGVIWTFPADSASASLLADSLNTRLENGWYKQPGQMPIFVPGLLPNSMSFIVPPKVDEEMILPLNQAVRDTAATQK